MAWGERLATWWETKIMRLVEGLYETIKYLDSIKVCNDQNLSIYMSDMNLNRASPI